MFHSKKLKRFKEIKHCFFSKKNGYSTGVYKSLNCGIGSGDKKNIVRKNLNSVCKKIKCNKNKLILMNQTHSNNFKFVGSLKKTKGKKPRKSKKKWSPTKNRAEKTPKSKKKMEPKKNREKKAPQKIYIVF